MGEIHEIIKASVSNGLWHFVGYWLMIGLILGVVIGIPAQLIIFIINRPLRHKNIRLHGYPPPHCDADGDFKKEKDDE